MRFLTNEDVEALVSMPQAIELMRQLFVEIAHGSVDLPERAVLEANDGRDAVLFMPGQLRGSRRIGVKVVTVFPGNPAAHGLPTIAATVLLCSPGTGRVEAVLEGTYLTALRTGAVSGLATDLLARTDARTLGVFGAGAQARTQVAAVCAVRGIDRILVWSPRRERAEALATEASRWAGRAVTAEVGDSPDAVAAAADVIVTATTSRVPVFSGRALRPGTHVNAIGSFKPSVREVDDDTIRRAALFVDHRASAMKEAGDLLIPLAAGVIGEQAVRGDLADIVSGRLRGRRTADDITFFKSVGLAAEDLKVAGYVLEQSGAATGGAARADRS